MQRLLVALLLVACMALPGCASVSNDAVELAPDEEIDDGWFATVGTSCVLEPMIT